MQLRLFRHFVPVSVVLLVSSDALLITGAFYHMLSQAGAGSNSVFGVSRFSAQFAAGLSVAAVAAMLSVGLYRQDSFLSFRLLIVKLAVVSGIVLAAGVMAAAWWRDGLADLANVADLPLKATLIWLGCIAVTRGTFLMTLGRGLLQRRVLVLGHGRQAARIERLVDHGANQHFVPLSFLAMPGEAAAVRSPVARLVCLGIRCSGRDRLSPGRQRNRRRHRRSPWLCPCSSCCIASSRASE